MKCTHCGNELEAGMKFCNSCGAPVEEPVQAQENTPVAEPTPVAESKENPMNGILDKVKGLPAKNLIMGGGAVVAIILVACLLTTLLGSIFGPKEANCAVYVKDKELHISMLNGKEPIEITSDFMGGYSSYDLLQNVPSLVKVTPDGKTVIYPDEFDSSTSTFNLYYRSATKEDAEEERIAKNITSYTLSDDGKRLLYISEGDLYEYDFKDSERVDKNVYTYWTTEDCKTILYLKDYSWGDNYQLVGDLYKKTFGNDKDEKIEKNVTLVSVSKDLNTIYYKDEDKLFIKKGNKDAEKIDKDVSRVVASYENGTAYFIKTETENSTLDKYVVDDMKEKDAAMVQPAYPSYGDFAWPNYPYSFTWENDDTYAGCETWDDAYELYKTLYEQVENEYNAAYTAYNEAIDLWYDKSDRDYYREYMSSYEISTEKSTLYYFDGKEVIEIAEDISENNFSTSNLDGEAVVAVMVEKAGDGVTIKMSEITGLYDATEKVKESLKASATPAIVKGDKLTEVDLDNVSSSYVAEDGKNVYVLHDWDMETYSYTLSKVSVSNGKAEEIDDEVTSVITAENGDYIYLKNDGDQYSEIFLNGESVAKDVSSIRIVEDDSLKTFYYMKDVSDTEGTLCYYDGKEHEIGDDIYYAYTVTAKGGVLYFEKYDASEMEGKLYYSENGKEGEEIDKGVTTVVNPYLYVE